MTTTPKQAASDQEEPRLEMPPKPKQLAHLSDEAWARAWELASRPVRIYPEHADKFCNEDYELEFVDDEGNSIRVDEDEDEPADKADALIERKLADRADASSARACPAGDRPRSMPEKPKGVSDEAWGQATRPPRIVPEHEDKFVNLDAPFTLVDEDGNEYVPDEELDEDEGK